MSCREVGRMLSGTSWSGTRALLQMVVIILMMITSFAAPATSEEDSGIERTSRRQRRMERQLTLTAQSDVKNNSTISYYSANVSGDDAVEQLPKRRLIRGSKMAVTITKRQYLKSDWCRTEPFQQIIHMDGCLRKRILNRFCYGQCNSFYIPKSRPEMPAYDDNEQADSAHFRSCAVCAPKKTVWTTVVLRCPRLLPSFRRRRVRVVRHCKCLAVRVRR